VYAATVKDRRLNFCVSGMLWKRSLVMKDLETGTLWSHILGEAMAGELKGTKLEMLPSAMTSWEDWKSEHPKTTVLSLSRTADRFIPEFQKDPGKFVLGIGGLGEKVAFAFEDLAKRKVINETLGAKLLVATFDPETTEAHCFNRTLGGTTLEFESADEPRRMRDRLTKSIWHTESGICLSGPMKDKALEEIPALVSFRRAWFGFHPDSRESGK
jgi:hypothetical protein